MELQRLLIRQFDNLRTVDSADFELIARLDELDHLLPRESMYDGCGCRHGVNQHMVSVGCCETQPDMCILEQCKQKTRYTDVQS